MKRKKVKKMLSPEEMTALSNIQSILTELMAMSEGGAPAETPVEMAEMEDEKEVEMADGEMMDTPEEEATDEKEVKMIIKGIEETPSDAATASDDTEERMDEVQTEQTEENVMEVAKQLAVALSHMGKNVKKSAVKKASPLEQALMQIVKIQKAQNEKVDVLAESFSHVLEGMGIVKQLEVAKSQTSKQPIVDNDNQAVLKAIQDALGINKEQHTEHESYVSNSQKVKKNLGSADVLKGLLGK